MFYTILTRAIMAGVEDPTLRDGLRDEDVTPGVVGFLATFGFVLMAIVVFSIRSRQSRRDKLRSSTAQDMLVERNQPHLSTDDRQRSDIDDLNLSQTEVLRKKYPGYLDMPTLEAQEPDTGRDH